MAEGSDRLRLVVLENAESALVQGRHQMVLVVHHRSVQHHFFNFLLEDEDSAIARSLPLVLIWLSLVCLRLGWLGWLRLAGLSLIFLALLLRSDDCEP